MRTSESCGCGGSFSGSARNWEKWRKAHGCTPDDQGKRVYGSDTMTQVQTQDGRWTPASYIPEIV